MLNMLTLLGLCAPAARSAHACGCVGCRLRHRHRPHAVMHPPASLAAASVHPNQVQRIAARLPPAIRYPPHPHAAWLPPWPLQERGCCSHLCMCGRLLPLAAGLIVEASHLLGHILLLVHVLQGAQQQGSGVLVRCQQHKRGRPGTLLLLSPAAAALRRPAVHGLVDAVRAVAQCCMHAAA